MLSRVRASRRCARLSASLIAAALTVGLMIPASASAAAPFKAKLHAPNHSPVIGKLWPITITVTRGNVKLSGSVRYQFLFNGQLESTQPGKSFKNGLYKDGLMFPAQSLGIPLTLKIIIKTKYGTVSIPWAVTSTKA